nr:reverse transcriptase [Tanacetum cinerariifolium]
MKWLPKLMEFDYEVKYKKGIDKATAVALSRVQNEEHGQLMTTMVMTVPIYGQSPTIHVPSFGGLSKVDAVDKTLEAREQAIKMLKFHLERSQNIMKQRADKKRSDRVLRDWVFLKLQPHTQEGLLEPDPIALSDRKMIKNINAVVVYVLVQWADRSKEDATWEILEDFDTKIHVNVKDTEDILDDATKSQTKMDNKLKDPVATEKK